MGADPEMKWTASQPERRTIEQKKPGIVRQNGARCPAFLCAGSERDVIKIARLNPGREVAFLRGAGHADMEKVANFENSIEETAANVYNARGEIPLADLLPPGQKKTSREIGHRQRANPLQRVA